jgi:hypothetical protein
MCERCEKRLAKGGHRFCYGCLGWILSQPVPIRESPAGYQYPERPKKKRTK